MPYVMVPVPEEHVEEVMQFMLRAMSRANLAEWDQESVDALYAQIDEFGRSALAVVGRHAAAEKELPEADLASFLQLSPRESIAIVREVNEACRELERPSLLLRRTFTEVLPNGRANDVAVVGMDEDAIALVNVAVDADRAAASGPLDNAE